jgi:hypothetical protein
VGQVSNAGSDFDVNALYDALDAQRNERGISWTQLTRELNDLFRDVKLARPIATSTVTGMRDKGGLNGNGVIQMLIWLKRTPESFCPGWPVKGKLFPVVPADRIVRWYGPKIYEALDTQREERGLSWKQVAEEIGWQTPASLKRLQTSFGIGFPYGMRMFRWLGKPAADFSVGTAM